MDIVSVALDQTQNFHRRFVEALGASYSSLYSTWIQSLQHSSSHMSGGQVQFENLCQNSVLRQSMDGMYKYIYIYIYI